MEIKTNQDLIKEISIAIKSDGFYFLKDKPFDDQYCNDVINNIDKFIEKNQTEENFSGSENRIWNSENKIKLINKFYDFSQQIITKINKRETKINNILAIRNRKVVNLIDNKNRWHIDSISSQLKVFMFLNDTSEESGCLEFIQNTNKSFFRLIKLITPNYFINYLNPLDKFRKYDAIPDEKILKLIKKGYKTYPVIVKKGTILIINTSKLIHRARPAINSERYALTAYI